MNSFFDDHQAACSFFYQGPYACAMQSGLSGRQLLPKAMRVIALLVFAVFLGMSAGVLPIGKASAQPIQSVNVASPDGGISVSVSMEGGRAFYAVTYNGEPVVSRSRLGLLFKDSHAFDGDLKLAASSTSSTDETWEQPWGERRLVRDRHNELVVTLESTAGPARRLNVRFRVFDDGVGFRYEVPAQKAFRKVAIINELTEFTLQPDATAWWIPGREWNRYEYLYNTTELSEMGRAHTPMTVRTPNGVHLSIHEAALVDYAAFVLQQKRPGVLHADLTPLSNGVRVKTEAPFTSSWRTIQISADAIGLLNSDLILNLNEPNKLGDVSWVQPGKYIGIWWAMHIRERTWGSGPEHGATTSETKRYMDFAAENGFDGVLVEGWNIGWDGDWFNNGEVFRFAEPYPDFDIEEVSRYGLAKNVRLIGHHETSGHVSNYEDQLSAAFDLYERLGVAQVKTGYVADGGGLRWVDDKGVTHYEWHDSQFSAQHHLKVLNEAAKRKISINAHEPIKDTGLRRTYPNWIAREGARGQEFNAWGTPPNTPEHTAILPFTRMLSGPMDYTPGVLDLLFAGPESPNRIPSTIAKELSLYVVLYSPIQMAADLPENYSKYEKAFQFIKDVPTDWEESRALAGEVGDYVAFARKQRGGEDWFIGALTDEHAREIDVSLEFLHPGRKYIATIYADGPKAHWQTNPFDLRVYDLEVTSADSLNLVMAASGGAAIRLRPAAP